MSWWQDAVIYQVYPRSFMDSNGDGVGDLAGIERRLDHIADLGATALWLSPVYPSPGADMGYDVADFCDIDPMFGDLAAFDRLLAAAHDRGLRLLMDLVPCHSSIEHPWFHQRPDYYVRVDGPELPNNWLATFGGPPESGESRSQGSGAGAVGRREPHPPVRARHRRQPDRVGFGRWRHPTPS